MNKKIFIPVDMFAELNNKSHFGNLMGLGDFDPCQIHFHN